MATPKTDNIKKIIRISTVISVLIMLIAIGWTAFFMLQILEIIPSFHGATATEVSTDNIESINSSLLDRVMAQLKQKTERPEPKASDLQNPFAIPAEVAPPAPPAALETPPPPVPPAVE